MMLLTAWVFQVSFAIEPMDPKAMCEQRMIHADQRQECKKKASTLKLDWYVATACNALNDDKMFLACWQSVSGGEFNPEALSRCVESPDDTDEAILTCIVSLKNKRSPASARASLRPVPKASAKKSKKSSRSVEPSK